MDYDHHILYHLKSPPCNEMMTFYLYFLEFESSSVIVLLNETLLKVSSNPNTYYTKLKGTPIKITLICPKNGRGLLYNYPHYKTW
jgi:hypothetical protein